MEQSLLEQIDEYIEEYYWYSERRIERRKQLEDVKFSVGRIEEPWSQRMKKRFDFIFAHLEDTFTQRLWKLIKKKGMSDVEVYKKAHLDRRLFSKIRNEKAYRPSKGTAIALGLALELSEEEFEDLLKRAGFALSGGNKEDVIINYFIEHGNYDVQLINEVLVCYGFPTLGERKK
jgi:hypothetical protein